MLLTNSVKKALDPVSFLIIGGTFVLGSIASSFFGSIGRDGWEVFKKKLGEILAKKRTDTGEVVLQWDILLKKEHCSVTVLATNPTMSDIDTLFDHHAQQIDSMVKKVLQMSSDIRVIVFEYQQDDLSIKYVIRRDGKPFLV